MLLALVGLLGLAVGSFLNVVIHRVPRGESLLRPGSHCPQCTAPIRPWHNVPVLGWLLLRGRCADCAAPISARYPLVEAGTAALFVAVAARFGWSGEPARIPVPGADRGRPRPDRPRRHAAAQRDRAAVLPRRRRCCSCPPSWSSGTGPRRLRGLLADGRAVHLLLRCCAPVYPGAWASATSSSPACSASTSAGSAGARSPSATFAGFLLGGVVGVALMAAGRAGRKTALPFGPSCSPARCSRCSPRRRSPTGTLHPLCPPDGSTEGARWLPST